MKTYFNDNPKDSVNRLCLYGAIALLMTPVMSTIAVVYTSRHDTMSPTTRSVIVHLSVALPLLFFRCCATSVFSTFAVIVNASVTKEMRGTINGLVMVGGSIGNATGPIVGSILYAVLVDAPKPFDGRYIFLIATILLIVFAVVIKKYLVVDDD